MNRYVAYTPMTDTTELKAVLRGRPLADLPTVEIGFPWWLPSPPTRYERPSRLARILRSPFARHLKASAQSPLTFWTAACCSGLILAVTVLAYVQAIAPTTAIR